MVLRLARGLHRQGAHRLYRCCQGRPLLRDGLAAHRQRKYRRVDFRSHHHRTRVAQRDFLMVGRPQYEAGPRPLLERQQAVGPYPAAHPRGLPAWRLPLGRLAHFLQHERAVLLFARQRANVALRQLHHLGRTACRNGYRLLGRSRLQPCALPRLGLGHGELPEGRRAI